MLSRQNEWSHIFIPPCMIVVVCMCKRCKDESCVLFSKCGAWFDYVPSFPSAAPFIAYNSYHKFEFDQRGAWSDLWQLILHCVRLAWYGKRRMEGRMVGGGLQNDALQEAQWVDVRGNKKSACASLKTENANEARAPSRNTASRYRPGSCTALYVVSDLACRGTKCSPGRRRKLHLNVQATDLWERGSPASWKSNIPALSVLNCSYPHCCTQNWKENNLSLSWDNGTEPATECAAMLATQTHPCVLKKETWNTAGNLWEPNTEVV